MKKSIKKLEAKTLKNTTKVKGGGIQPMFFEVGIHEYVG
jgi:hypothetical protein